MKVVLLSSYRGRYQGSSGGVTVLDLVPGEQDLPEEIVAFLRFDSPGLISHDSPALPAAPPKDKALRPGRSPRTVVKNLPGEES